MLACKVEWLAGLEGRRGVECTGASGPKVQGQEREREKNRRLCSTSQKQGNVILDGQSSNVTDKVHLGRQADLKKIGKGWRLDGSKASASAIVLACLRGGLRGGARIAPSQSQQSG